MRRKPFKALVIGRCANLLSGKAGIVLAAAEPSLCEIVCNAAGAGYQTKPAFTMKGVKKQHLPQKVCIVCKRPFTWRKKWEKVWDDVKYCSDRCRNARVH